MADYEPNQMLNTDGSWTDVTGELAGKNVVIQNASTVGFINIFFGEVRPSSKTDGLALPPHNWPPHFGTISTRLWARGAGRIHIASALTQDKEQ